MTLSGPPRARHRPAGWIADVAGAAAAAVLLVVITSHIPPGGGERELDVFGYGLLVAAGAAMALCRRLPAVALAVVALALSMYVLRDYPGGPIFLTGWFALVSLSWREGRRAGIAGAAVLVGALVAAAATEASVASGAFLVFVGWSAAAVLAGDVLRTRGERFAQLEERARQLERTREEEARRQTAEERLRIARDIHDSVAHAMTTINVQAGAAAYVVERRPAAAKEALTAIQRASGDVLDELSALVGLLRSAGEAADRAPTPGLDRIASLVEATRSANLSVTLGIDGPLAAVPLPVGTAAYRIVQESLTNVIRHAPGATAAVTIAADDQGGLVVEVVDDGGSQPEKSAGTGTGIRGMRERAEATGGTLHAGPRSGGGWTVRAAWSRP